MRNPWARVFSWYGNVMRDEVHKKRFGVKQYCSFSGILDSHMVQFELKPQLFWIQDKQKRIPMDIIGRFEPWSGIFDSRSTGSA